MKKLFLILLLISSTAWADCTGMVALGKPVVESGTPTYLCRKMYVIEHSESRHTAYWAAEHLLGHQQDLKGKRVNKFRPDPDLPTFAAAQLKDYYKSGWDRGHLAPVGDMYADPEAMLESFYLSNIIPQLAANNRRGWKWLEEYARNQSIEKGDLYVITGPVYQGPLKAIGKTQVRVPSHIYKILYDAKSNTALSFLVPNIPVTHLELYHYVSDVATIEQVTDIKFFPEAKTPVIDAFEMW